jgi:hypothetical protein
VIRTLRRLAPVVALALGVAAGCNDFLTGGDLDRDPNRPTTVTPAQLFVGVQSASWAILLSDLARFAGLWTQQFEGGGIQYTPIYEYQVDESTTNSWNQAFYISGGLPDVRALQALTRESGDQLFLGIAQVQEALLAGTAADVFGDIVYTNALKGTPNPTLTPQMEVYDSVQALLTTAITNMRATGVKNVGPGGADAIYGGDATKWIRLAHTLKARFYLHTAERRGNAVYQSARDEAAQGILDPADNYTAPFSGLPNQQNFWYQFDVIQRPGYLFPNEQFVALLTQRSDPRLGTYFNEDQSDFAASRVQPTTPLQLVTANENLLILAESEYRLGNQAAARTALNRERALVAGLQPVAGTVSGTDLLREILTEKYIALFQSIEVWNDYRRTCFPNITPTVSGQKIPARLFYDTAERQTNTSIPDPSAQPFRNANDPANATDPFGAACRGQ